MSERERFRPIVDVRTEDEREVAYQAKLADLQSRFPTQEDFDRMLEGLDEFDPEIASSSTVAALTEYFLQLQEEKIIQHPGYVEVPKFPEKLERMRTRQATEYKRRQEKKEAELRFAQAKALQEDEEYRENAWAPPKEVSRPSRRSLAKRILGWFRGVR